MQKTAKILVLCLFIGLLSMNSAESQSFESSVEESQNQESLAEITKSQPGNRAEEDNQVKLEFLKCNQNQSSFESVLEMHNWFTRELQSITRGLPKQQKSLQLLSVTSWVDIKDVPVIKAKRKIRLGMDYNLPLNTTNFHFGINLAGNEEWDLYGLGIIGAGSRRTPVFQYTNATTGQTVNDRVEANIGGGLELGKFFGKAAYFYFGGIINNVSLQQTSNGSNINLYGGLRYFTPLMTKYYHLAADIKIGKPWWSGFSSITGGHDIYGAAGITLVSRQPFGLAGTPRMAPLETSLLYSPFMSTISAKLAYPIRIYEQLSIAPSIQLGTDARTFQRDQKEISSIYGGGLDLRLYGDEMDKILNPYVSYNYYFLEYDERGANIGEGHIVHVGNRFSLGKKLYLDVYTGPAFWDRSVRIVGSTPSLNIDTPAVWDIGAGLTYSIGVEKPKKRAQLTKAVGSYVAYCGKAEELNDVPKGKLDVLSQAELNKKLEIAQEQIDAGEKDVNVVLTEERVYGILEPEEPPIPNYGDLTDLKFFTVDLGIWMGITKRHAIPFIDTKEDISNSSLFIVLFDKEKVKIDRIKDTNMYLHFVDLDSGRYFGYRYDRNRRMQPEYESKKTLNRDIKNGEIFYGRYEDYVRRMEWMTGSDFVDFLGNFQLSKDWMAGIIFNKMNNDNPTPDSSLHSSDCTFGEPLDFIAKNYQIAYVKYPSDIIKNLQHICHNFGASILFRFDMNDNFDVTDSLSGHFLTVSDVGLKNVNCLNKDEKTLASDQIISTDFDDCSFFSNIIPRVKFEYPDYNPPVPSKGTFVIDNFALCSANLTLSHKNTLEKVLEFSRNNPGLSIILFGSADGTIPTDKCKRTYGNDANRLLAMDRANVVAQYLQAHNVSTNRIEIANPAESSTVREPKDRAVIIQFR